MNVTFSDETVNASVVAEKVNSSIKNEIMNSALRIYDEGSTGGGIPDVPPGTTAPQARLPGTWVDAPSGGDAGLLVSDLEFRLLQVNDEIIQGVQYYVYSTEDGTLSFSFSEQELGINWIDGKPVYQGTYTGVMNSSIAHELHLGTLIEVRSTCLNADGTISYPIGYMNTFNVTQGARIYLNSTDIITSVGGALFTNGTLYSTLRYTKYF